MSTPTALWILFSTFLIGLAYFAALAFVGGLVWRLAGYLRTPAPLPATLTPAPTSNTGAARASPGMC